MKELGKLTYNSLESLIEVMSTQGITLFDTNVLLGPSYSYNLIEILRPFPTKISIPDLEEYNTYLYSITDKIMLNENILTSHEIIDKELLKMNQLIKKRIDGLHNFIHIVSSKNKKISIEEVDRVKYIIKILKGTLSSSKNLRLALEERLYHSGIIQNQFHMRVYKEYQFFINRVYNAFMEEDKREELCPDDGLIAMALLLLKIKKEPVKIISRDMGLFRRTKILNSIISYLHYKEQGFLHELNKGFLHELNEIGIFLYNNLNEEGVYRLCGTTQNSELRYNLKGVGWGLISSLKHSYNNIISLEKSLIGTS